MEDGEIRPLFLCYVKQLRQFPFIVVIYSFRPDFYEWKSDPFPFYNHYPFFRYRHVPPRGEMAELFGYIQLLAVGESIQSSNTKWLSFMHVGRSGRMLAHHSFPMCMHCRHIAVCLSCQLRYLATPTRISFYMLHLYGFAYNPVL